MCHAHEYDTQDRLTPFATPSTHIHTSTHIHIFVIEFVLYTVQTIQFEMLRKVSRLVIVLLLTFNK